MDSAHLAHILGILLIAMLLARALGYLATRLGQSAVLGELLAGILLGPSLFGLIDVHNNEVLFFLAEIGVILLLFEVGLESNVHEMLKSGKSSLLVAILGVIFPVALGFVYYYFTGHGSLVSLFIGATLAATSVGVTMRVFADMKKVNSPEGKIILGAAVIDDVLGLILLSVILSIMATGAVSVFSISKTIVFSVLFLVLTTVIGLRFAPMIFRLIQKLHMRGMLVVASFGLAMVLSVFSVKIGLATIVGSFAAGLILERTEQKAHIVEKIEPVSDLFVPLFFVVAGAQLDIHTLASMEVLWFVVSLTIIAIICKIIAGIGAWGDRKKASLMTIGMGMIPRGEVGLIFASAGLVGGLISAHVYSELVVVILLTTIVTPLMLSWWMGRSVAKA